MNGRKMPRGEAIVFGFLFVGMFCLVTFHEKLQEWNLVLPVIIVFVVAFLSFFVWQIAKEWKKPDEEIMEVAQSWKNGNFLNNPKKPVSYEDRK